MLLEIDRLVNRDFDEISERVNEIVLNSQNTEQAVREVAEYVSGKLSASCKGYIALLYSVKSKETLREEVFSSSENANKFYDLNLRQKLSELYDFNLMKSRSLNAALGSGNVSESGGSERTEETRCSFSGGISRIFSFFLFPVSFLSGFISAQHGLSGGTDQTAVHGGGKSLLAAKAQSFLLDLKSEMKDFLSGAEHYYDEQVSSLKKELDEKHDS